MEKKLERNPHNKIIAGVASGLADYFSVDISLIRVLFIILFVFGFSGILIYIVLWILVPERSSYQNFADPDYRTYNDSFNEPRPAPKSNSGRFIAGLLLIAIGCWFMLVEFNIIPDWFSIFKLWPIILIVLGVMILFKSDKRKKSTGFENSKPPVSDWDARSEPKSTSNPDDQPLS